MNCREPAAVASRHLVGHFLPSLIFGALAHAVPERVLAGGADPGWMSIWRANWPQTGKSSNFTLFQLGGTGARPTKDGLSTTGFPSGVGGVPAEIIETQAPLIQHHRQLRTDSGGAGQFRGGLGQETRFSHWGEEKWSVSGMIDRTQHPAQGLLKGQSGASGDFELNDVAVPPKTIMWMDAKDEITMNPPGGGGYGDPLTRDPQSVLNDVIHNYVSIAAARDLYGVVITFTGDETKLIKMPASYHLDLEATQALRQQAA